MCGPVATPVEDSVRASGPWDCPNCGSSRFSRRLAKPWRGETLSIVACLDCDLARLHPKVSFDYGGNDEYLEGGLLRSEAARSDAQARLADLLAYAHVPNGARLLEIGPGAGAFLDAARDAGYEAVGVEPTLHAAQHAKNRGHAVHVGRLEDRALPESSFDVVAFFHVLEHVEDPRGFLASVRRILRPGGVAFLETPIYRSVRAALSGNAWGGFTDQHLIYFSTTTLVRMVRNAGFSEIEWTGDLGRNRFAFLPSSLRILARGSYKSVYDALVVNDVARLFARRLDL